jgi:4-diphosphocytidyl-2-C-methyl-D-erythritol kinase
MLRVQAPAKLNLYLRVVGKRADGFHELETLFERIDLCDELQLELQPRQLQLTCSDPTLSCGEENLVLKAARALQQLTNTDQGAQLHLIKRIPIAAGLGGGSSDAAAALLGLNALWALGLDQQTLVKVAAQLGSDVPFFLWDVPFAVGRGRGEQGEPVTSEAQLAHILVTPDAQLATKEVYAGSRFDLTGTGASLSIALHALRNGSLGELVSGLRNDLAPEAIRRCPVIAAVQSLLRESGCLGVLLSGSGPSVFGLCRDLAHAHAVQAQVARRAPPAWRLSVVTTERTGAQRLLGE